MTRGEGGRTTVLCERCPRAGGGPCGLAYAAFARCRAVSWARDENVADRCPALATRYTHTTAKAYSMTLLTRFLGTRRQLRCTQRTVTYSVVSG